MHPTRWWWNATQRTVRGFHPALVDPDDTWAHGYLPRPERRLYDAMDARDRWHAVAVARAVLRMQPAASNRLVRAALLHDVGKSVRPYRLHERIAGHLLPRRWLGKQRGSAGYVAKHHARIGGAMIRDAGGSDDVARLVERHERFGTNDDPELAVLVTADRQT